MIGQLLSHLKTYFEIRHPEILYSDEKKIVVMVLLYGSECDSSGSSCITEKIAMKIIFNLHCEEIKWCMEKQIQEITALINHISGDVIRQEVIEWVMGKDE